MEYKYFIEFLGTLVFVFAHVFTYANPYMMSIATFSIYMIGSRSDAIYFSPLSVTASYFLGRLPLNEALYIILAQFVAVALIVITFKPIDIFMEK
jgi:glycerol uptake facilitator-like aquaporin